MISPRSVTYKQVVSGGTWWMLDSVMRIARPLGGHRGDGPRDRGDDGGGQPLEGLVEEEQVRVEGEGARDREHLPLAAGQLGPPRSEAAEVGEDRVGGLHAVRGGPPGGPGPRVGKRTLSATVRSPKMAWVGRPAIDWPRGSIRPAAGLR